MATRSKPIFASSFLRQSSLHGNLINNDSESNKDKFHWFNAENADCVKFDNKHEWLHLLSLISTRFIQVSWRILHDLQIAPPSNSNDLLVEVSYNGNKTVSYIQTIKNNQIKNDELIRFSPLIISDLHLSFHFDPNSSSSSSSLLSMHKMNQKIGLKNINFDSLPIAKCVRFQIINSLKTHSFTTNYTEIVSKFMTENKINEIELNKNKNLCVWKGQIIAIPFVEMSQTKNYKKMRGRNALKQFFANRECTKEHSVKYWIYVRIVDILQNNSKKTDQKSDIFRIIPTVSTFVQIEQNTNFKTPRLCEYFCAILLNPKCKNNEQNLYFHYHLPQFYQSLLQNVLFPNIFHRFSSSNKCKVKNINPSFLIVSSNGHRLSSNLDNIATILGINYVYKNCIELLGQNMSSTLEQMTNFLESALEFEPLLLCLDCLHLFEFEANIHSFYNVQGKMRPILPIINIFQQFFSKYASKKIIFFANCNDLSKIPRELRALFVYEHKIESIFDENGHCETEIIPLSLQPHIQNLNLINGLNTAQLFEIAHCTDLDYQSAIDNIRSRQSLANFNLNMNVSSIPSVKWADVGGLEQAKSQIFDIIQLPLQYSSIFAGIKQSFGILLYGPPGTGKTLLAKAIATEFNLNFISIKGPELLNPFVGESEANIRSVFEKAIESRPCILFFDEIDALVPSRGKSSDAGNVMDRVVSQLLTQIDAVSHKYNGKIFIIAATNRLDLLDAALLRPKRLDKQIYLGIATESEQKYKIIQALTRKFEFEGGESGKMNILKIVANKTEIESFTGADLYALCCDAMMVSMKALIEKMQRFASENDGLSVDLLIEMIQNNQRDELEKEYGLMVSDEEWDNMKDFKVRLNLSHFEEALKNIKPSLSKQEIIQYQAARQQQIK